MSEAELREFLGWFKVEAERFWTEHEPEFLPGMYPSPGHTVTDWHQGTRWQPYTEAQIRALEKRWGIEFPWDYRLFLQLLGTPDRPQLVSGFRDGDMLEVFERDGFMNWRADDLVVAERLNWPAVGLIDGTERPWWWADEWGAWHTDPWEMHSTEAARKILRVTRAAPQLVPFYAHRFLLPEQEQQSACLSVMGSDIIVWAHDLCGALLNDHLDLVIDPSAYNSPSEFEEAHAKLLRSSPLRDLPQYPEQDFSAIPFWGHFL